MPRIGLEKACAGHFLIEIEELFEGFVQGDAEQQRQLGCGIELSGLNGAWDNFFSLRASRSRFRSISSFSIHYTIAMEAMSSTSATAPQRSPYSMSSHSRTLYHWYRYTAAIMEQ